VEVDEVFIGGKKAWKRWRWAEGKLKVVIAVEINQTHANTEGLYRGMWRVRMKVIEDCSAPTLQAFIQENIESWSILYTDKWSGYTGIEKVGYSHIIQEATPEEQTFPWVNNVEVTPNVHIIASLLKRWLLGTHQQYCTKDGYLQDYLEEYTFRFNRRASGDRWKIFKTLIEKILTFWPTTLKWLQEKRDQNLW
jgi:transposase-like protein